MADLGQGAMELSAALLPFIVPYSQIGATTLAIVVAAVTVLDTVFSPKDKWTLYSKSTDLLALAQIKATGNYEKYKEVIDVILQTEAANLQQVIGLQSLLEQVGTQASSHQRPSKGDAMS
jgi:hypothetical protein